VQLLGQIAIVAMSLKIMHEIQNRHPLKTLRNVRLWN
jgi:hypothetical protein